jgi:CheY-like chemotaxis protein
MPFKHFVVQTPTEKRLPLLGPLRWGGVNSIGSGREFQNMPRPYHGAGSPHEFVSPLSPDRGEGSSAGGAVPGERRRVLVVDDNHDAADTLALLLELMGHEVRTAHDGLKALDVAEELRPDVVLLDIGLPQLNGYEVARRLRQQPWSRQTLLVALTGWGQAEDQLRSTEAGFDRHLVKPVDEAMLIRVLSETR